MAQTRPSPTLSRGFTRLGRFLAPYDVVYGGGGDEWHMLRLEPRVIQRLTGARVADVVEESTADPAGGAHA